MCIMRIFSVYRLSLGIYPCDDRYWLDLSHQWLPLCRDTLNQTDSMQITSSHDHLCVRNWCSISIRFDLSRTFHSWKLMLAIWNQKMYSITRTFNQMENLMSCLPKTEWMAFEWCIFSETDTFTFAIKFRWDGNHFFNSRREQFSRWTIAQITHCNFEGKKTIWFKCIRFVRKWRVELTFLVFVISNWLNFTAMAVAGALIHIKCSIVNQVPIFVHITNGPIGQLTIINDAACCLWTISFDRVSNSNILKQKKNR